MPQVLTFLTCVDMECSRSVRVKGNRDKHHLDVSIDSISPLLLHRVLQPAFDRT